MALSRSSQTRLFACFFFAALAALAPPPRHSIARQTAADTPRTIYVTVETEDGNIIGGLGSEAFGVFDGETKVPMVSFDREGPPTTVGLVLDSSGSMRPDGRESLFVKMKTALQSLVVTAGKADEFFLVVFNEQPQLILRDTSDKGAVLAAFERLAAARTYGQTALYDSLYLALNHASNGRHARRALVVVTDGGDSVSKFSPGELKRALRESDVIVYVVNFNPNNYGDIYPDAKVLSELAELSGGKVYKARTAARLEEALKLVALELRRQYAIGIAPAPARRKDGWHEIEIRMAKGRDPRGKMHKLRARTRKGFYWPLRGG